MDWSSPIDLYCERLAPDLLAEPVNAISNLAFLAAAWSLRSRLDARHGGDLLWLQCLLALVGCGSLIFHTVATRWASVLDVAFIAIFVLLYVHRALVRLFGWPARRAAGAVVGVLLTTAALAAALRLPALNGSELYLGPWLALIILAIGCPHAAAARWLRLAAGLFALSMAFRSLDLRLCALWPIGTHFAWHLNNALVLWCAMRALLEPSTSAPPSRHAS
ncbi:MAG: hypothetical protein H6945_12835 [Zoogloeaceae bacterium]|nr:hypothetical protein [Rhodocyclaceae bacterium]MCP5236610.1 hypothetical protein [Zoogloeaceae bacterium]